MKEKISLAIQDAITRRVRFAIEFIDRLCEQNIITYPIDYETCYPSDKELTETLTCWFGGSKWSKNGDCFVQFAQDGTGSLFLLWFYPSLEIDNNQSRQRVTP